MHELECLLEAMSRAGLKAELRKANPDGWNKVWLELSYQPVPYAKSTLDYYHAYFRGIGWDIEDVSLVLLNDNSPCGIWPLSLGINSSGKTELINMGAGLASPLFIAGLSPKTVKKICSNALKFLNELGRIIGLPKIDVEQWVEPSRSGMGVPEWHQLLMSAGAVPAVRHDLFVDLARTMGEIRSNFRKSYKSLINAGLRNWDVFTVDESNVSKAQWDEFKSLHSTVAGRSTRSDRTWGIHLAMIKDGEAFLTCLRDPADGNLVGGGFFQHTRDEGVYAVAVYDRRLFDKPLGHVVQQIAIERMKERGLKWYRIGERFYAQNNPCPSDKEVSISSFKQGFASHMFCRYVFQLPVANDQAVRNKCC